MTMIASNIPMSPHTICTHAVFCLLRALYASPDMSGHVTFSPNSFNINTYEKRVCNSFIINTYKNKGLKVLYHQHLRKRGYPHPLFCVILRSCSYKDAGTHYG